MVVWLAAAVIGCGGGPSLHGSTWALGDPLVGDDYLTQLEVAPRCTLSFSLEVDQLRWDQACIRNDLPTKIFEAPLDGPGHLYDVSGGAGTSGQWMTRDGDHPALFELWVFPPDPKVTDSHAFNVDQVIPMWRLQ